MKHLRAKTGHFNRFHFVFARLFFMTNSTLWFIYVERYNQILIRLSELDHSDTHTHTHTRYTVYYFPFDLIIIAFCFWCRLKPLYVIMHGMKVIALCIMAYKYHQMGLLFV